MSHLLDLTGQTFGRLTAIEKTRGPHPAKCYWRCVCVCGKESIVDGQKLRRGTTQSCACLQRDKTRERFTIHGGRKDRVYSAEYSCWSNMRQRCLNPDLSHFKDYGGRGIQICERWDDFANFLADMGPRPSGTSLDRIDNQGDYTPENCRWATPNEQARNHRANRLVICDGELITIAEAAERKGLPRQTIYQRIHRGWPESRWLIPKAFTTHR